MEVVCEHTCGSANNVSKAVVLIEEYNHVIYAICNLLVVADASTQSILTTLKGHKANISAITLINSGSDGEEGCSHPIELVTGSEDGTLLIWKKCEAKDGYYKEGILEDLKFSLVSLDGFENRFGSLISACDSHGNMYIWFRPLESNSEKVDYRLVYKQSFVPAQMVNCICINTLPDTDSHVLGDKYLFILGGVDCRVTIKVFSAPDLLAAYASADSDTRVNIEGQVAGVLMGHEDWITCLSCAAVNGVFMIASGSQDSKIRLWKLVLFSNPAGGNVAQAVTTTHKSIGTDVYNEDYDDGEEDRVIPATEDEFSRSDDARFVFQISEKGVWVAGSLEALLIGHEDWVTSVRWLKSNSHFPSGQLFSTSMDRNMLLWGAEESGVWMPTVRLGDIGGSLGGSVGANLLGFVNGVITESGRSIIGIGFGGAFHLWQGTNAKEDIEGRERWLPKPFPTGHFGAVSDISWSPDGSYLVSVSSDQTCRLFSQIDSKFRPHINLFGTATIPDERTDNTFCWREVSRPQVHGYDLNAVVCSPSVKNLLFSGGDEKVIRIFQASQIVIDGLNNLCVGAKSSLDDDVVSTSEIPRAFAPALGLSNKAVDLMNSDEKEEMQSRRVELMEWVEPPLEGQLADHTLWPEIKKMFGHTSDVMCMSISHRGDILASACKGRNPETSSIILWNTTTMSQMGKIMSHESTVVCIRFSPSDRFIMSVSKDRGLCISELFDSSTYHAVILRKNAHKRIIWDCSWCGDTAVVTGSRDGVCKVWSLCSSMGPDSSSLDLEVLFEFRPFEGVSITSLDIAPLCLDTGGFILAVGAESGDIKLWGLTIGVGASENVTEPIIINSVDPAFSHGLSVKRIRWCPVSSAEGGAFTAGGSMRFASCGEDRCIRIFSVNAK